MSFTPRALSVAIFFGLSVGGLSLACSSASPKAAPPFDAAAESAKLMARDAHWADLATAAKNVDSVVSYWTDDAVIMEPGQPVVEGKAAIRKFVEDAFKTPGKMAYMRATDEMNEPGPKGAPITLHMRGYSIWRIDSDGQWRCVVDIANEAPPPPNATKS